MLKKIYARFMALAAHPQAVFVLAAAAFAESSFFPIPPDVLLIPIVLAAAKKAWIAALVCTLSSVLGGGFGYGIGFFLRDFALGWIERLGWTEAFSLFSLKYNETGPLIVFIGGFTPFPYKLTTIASGLVEMNFLAFMIASLFSRGLRFFLIAALLRAYGEKARIFIEKHLGVLSILFVLLLVGFLFLGKLF